MFKLPQIVLFSCVGILALGNELLKEDPVPSYKRGLTDHFINWLNSTSGYEPYGFNRTEFFGGSFGGKEDDSTPIVKRPVIFIHGNGDQIIGEEWANNGFHYTIEYFLSKGYTKAELYGSMWGFNDVPHEPQHIHEAVYVM